MKTEMYVMKDFKKELLDLWKGSSDGFKAMMLNILANESNSKDIIQANTVGNKH